MTFGYSQVERNIVDRIAALYEKAITIALNSLDADISHYCDVSDTDATQECLVTYNLIAGYAGRETKSIEDYK